MSPEEIGEIMRVALESMPVGTERWGRRWHALQQKFGAEMRVQVCEGIYGETKVLLVLDRVIARGPGYTDFFRVAVKRVPRRELQSRRDALRRTEGLDEKAALIEAAIPYLMD